MRDLLKRIRSLAFVATVVWGIGPGCPPPPPELTIWVERYEVSDDGTKMDLTLYVSPPAGTLYIECSDGTPFDTVVLSEGTDSLEYSLDSTFLASCSDHTWTRFTYTYEGDKTMMDLPHSDVPVRTIGYPNRPRKVVIDYRDTVFIYDDSSGYVLTSNGYVKFAPYTGGVYAPIPPDPYTDTLSISEGGTAVVWIDHDRDGAEGYDGDDLFGVLTATPDGVRFSVLGLLYANPTLTGYRGLDLCFRCSM